MNTNFALSLSFDGLSLMHRVPDGWNMVGQVALDDADLTGALARLRDIARTLEPSGMATKLLIPNDQIKYIALDTTRAEDDDVRAALDGATPYAVSDLVYDFAKGGGRTYIAAVARETLEEAREFAAEHQFNPVSFAAVPEPFTYVGEAFFGATPGQSAERDAQPVVVTGTAAVAGIAGVQAATTVADAPSNPTEPVSSEPEPPAPEPASTEPETPEPEVAERDMVKPDVSASVPDAIETVEPIEPIKEAVEAEPIADAEIVPDEVSAPVADTPPAADMDVPVVAPEQHEATDPEPTIEDAPEPAPVFSSRLRADRSEGQPQEKPAQTPAARAEPTVRRQEPAPLAVPTGTGNVKTTPLAAPSREVAAPPAPSVHADTPDVTPEAAPAITGDAPTALAPDEAVTAAPLTADADQSIAQSAASDAKGATSALGGAVGGMFASRRMARAQAKAREDAAALEAKAAGKTKRSVFGGRKQPKPKPVVGGKPRFLGLILTAILLLFLLAFAAFAALSDDTVARWFGFGEQSDTEVALAPEVETPQEVAPEPEQEASEQVVQVPAEEPSLPQDIQVDDALATATAVPGGRVLSPQEAARIYAATGVWQRAPRIPLTPRTATFEPPAFGQAAEPIARVPASPLLTSAAISGDALIATPIDPPAPDVEFDFGDDGLIVATPDGAVTPDGTLIIAGAPALNPPTRPGTVAPEITPQDLIATVIPDTAEPVTDAPEGVIVIAGRPVIEPPVRTGTAAPAPAPEAEALASGEAPLVADEGLLVLAGTPPVLPPVRRGTSAPTVAPPASADTPSEDVDTPTIDVLTAPAPTVDTPDEAIAVAEQPDVQPVVPPLVDLAVPEALAPVIESAPETADAVTPELSETQNETVTVIAGTPSILPPARPGTIAPQAESTISDLSQDVAAALSSGGGAQTPDANPPRPLPRPAAVIEAAVAAANAPVLGALSASEALEFRPRERPAGIAPEPAPEPEPEPEQVAEPDAAPAETGLQIAPEIAAAVAAAAARPDPLVNPTALAVAQSSRPDTRPRNMARIVERATANQQQAAAQVASVAPRTVTPSAPTTGSVAQAATVENAINLRDVNLIGIFGDAGDRRALVRLANGRYVRVTVGDRIDGGRVTAISASALSYTKGGRALTLEVAG